MSRIVTAHTPLGQDQLMFRSMHGTESLSQLFEFEVDLLSPSTSIDMKSVLGKPLTLEILTIDGVPRYLNGQITRFTMMGREDSSSRYVVYRAQVRPWLWYLTRTSDCKIFQNRSVVEILREVLGEYGFPFEMRLSASYRQWEYCVQYQETDFAFVSRLMEHEGIYYFFKHENGQHTLVLADDMGAHEKLPEYPTISYVSTDHGGSEGRECIDRWEVTEEIRPGTYVVDDFDFKKPKADLINVRSQPRGTDHGHYEMYEWLGGFSDAGQGEHYARIRLEEAQAHAELDFGHATVRGMAPGYHFAMRNAPRNEDNREYLIVSVTYALREGGYASGADAGLYSFDFSVQPTSFAYRPPRVTRQPHTNGPQTATVVGPAGEDIWIDKYGRVKVQFRWDRYGQSNENSSCWVRVSSAWAGSNFGAVNHPRVGQEVIVDFIGGCPDRPIIIGRVYNADQMPPLELPAKATVSGFISRTIQGDGELANHFVIDDDPSNESITIHAQKDFVLEVENDETHTVEKGNETHSVERGSRITHIAKNDELTVGQARTTTVNNGLDHAIYKAGSKLEVTKKAEHFFNNKIEITTHDGATETVETGVSAVHVKGDWRDEKFDNGLRVNVEGRGMSETVKSGGSTVLVQSGLREETYQEGWERTVTGGDAKDSIDDNYTIDVGNAMTTTVVGAASLTSETANIDIKAATKILLDAPEVEDTSKSKLTISDWAIAFKIFNMNSFGTYLGAHGLSATWNSTNLAFASTSVTNSRISATFSKIAIKNRPINVTLKKMSVKNVRSTISTGDLYLKQRKLQVHT